MFLSWLIVDDHAEIRARIHRITVDATHRERRARRDSVISLIFISDLNVIQTAICHTVPMSLYLS
jgi:hypothetical protein